MGNEGFRVLLVYSNSPMENLIPVSISSLSGALKRAGFRVDLFDNTFYPGRDEKTCDEERVALLQVPVFNWEDVGISYRQSDQFEDFRRKVLEYQPHLIGLSSVEPTFPNGVALLRRVRDLGIPTIVGGVHAIFRPEEVFEEDVVDMVCVGEGEECMVQLCEKMARGEDYAAVPNIWVKKDGKEYRNPKSSVQNAAALPYLDFEIFERDRFVRPMSGKMWRMVPVEFSRGCMYKCAYCSAPAFEETFKEQGEWLRDKPMKQILDEIGFYRAKYNVQFFYFVSETFLAMSKRRFQEFVEGYKEIRLPFWFNTRPETLTERNIRDLEDIGCFRMSVGVESGNEAYRRSMLRRPVSNERVIRGCRMVAASKIQLSVNNIIGFPDETRDMMMDTVNLNREFFAEGVSAYIFQPYGGTWLREYCVKKGYWGAREMATDLNMKPAIRQPHISHGQLMAFQRVFPLYVRFPKSEWPRIERAEKSDDEGLRILNEYAQVYRKEFFRAATLEAPLNPVGPSQGVPAAA
ncbi:MAG: B12-binding domain-containing radical SAM protein [Nitrospirae bacterium]|nr:B12-binding domain-containing radical SAM protein [Nitrospirota bacterium]